MNKKVLFNLRELMSENKIDAYLTVSTDPHQSEYIPPFWLRNKFLTGFTGVYCRTVVTKKKAMLWTDGKEAIKVKKELKNSLFKYQVKTLVTPDLNDEITWISKELKNGGTIGVDPRIMTIAQMESLKDLVAKQKNLSIKYVENNLIDEVWEERPSMPKSPVIIRNKKLEKTSVGKKLKTIAKELKKSACDLHIVSNLESIARSLNARATDVEYNPLVISYLVVGTKSSYWFIDKDRIAPEYKKLLPSNLKLLPYDSFAKELESLSVSKTVMIDKNEVSQWVLNHIHPSAKIRYQTSPITKMKAIKNSFEIKMMSNACLRDSLYLAEAIYWIKNEVKRRSVTECELIDKIKEFKNKDKNYLELSFEPIAAYNKNAAVIHYEPKLLASCSTIKNKGIVLIDCGAHFTDGTTDATRTFTVGKVKSKVKQDYTRVLKGHLALNMLKFPAGTKGYHVDALARQFLWEAGLNYSHGTGHGVGYVTSVHETAGFGITPLRPMSIDEGMVFSNEPGYYKEGHYGIRIENMVFVEKHKDKFLKLAQMTYCPYERELIDVKMLDRKELDWINKYHKIVLKKLKPMIKDRTMLDWLKKACAPII